MGHKRPRIQLDHAEHLALDHQRGACSGYGIRPVSASVRLSEDGLRYIAVVSYVTRDTGDPVDVFPCVVVLDANTGYVLPRPWEPDAPQEPTLFRGRE